MKGEGPREERETIINFNEKEDTASVWTASDVVYRHLLKRLGRAYLHEDGERHAEFRFPQEFIILPRVKVKKDLSPAELQARTDRILRRQKTSGDKPQTDPE